MSADMLRLLFVTDETLRPIDRGMRVRISTLLAGCARAAAVTLLAPMPDAEDGRRELETMCDRVVWLGEQGAARSARIWWAAARAAPGLRKGIGRYARFVAALGALDVRSFDLVWAERPHVARLFERERARTVIDLDDLEHRRMVRARMVEGARPPVATRLAAGYRMRLYRWLELTWSRDFLATVVCSDEDRRYMEQMGVRNAVVVPNGVNEGAVSVAPRGAATRQRAAPRIVFLGNLGHAPNADAITHCAREILPILRATYPDLVLDVIGPGASAADRDRFGSHVRFHGFVPDLSTALADYDVLVAPIRYGGGTRVKLLDAMACGIPIVTTPSGAEGLPVEDGTHLAIARDPTEFADKVRCVLGDRDLADRLAANAAALVDARYRSSAIEARVADLIRSLAVEAGPARQ